MVYVAYLVSICSTFELILKLHLVCCLIYSLETLCNILSHEYCELKRLFLFSHKLQLSTSIFILYSNDFMLLLAGHFKTEIFTTSKDEIPPTPNSVVSGGDSSEDLE